MVPVRIGNLRGRNIAACIPRVRCATAGLLVLLAAASIVGCAKQDSSLTGDREIRLTEGDGFHGFPAFSPDGRFIAYSSSPAEHRGVTTIQVIPARGGKIHTVRVDSSTARVSAWAPDGRSLFVQLKEDQSLRRMTLSGQVVQTYERPNMAYFVNVSPDGKRLLYRIFNGDNWDLGLVRAGSAAKLELLAKTPAWEGSGCFGPGPGEVTVVSQTVYGASVSDFFVWSPDTREYRPIPVPKAMNRNPCWSPDGRYLAYSSDQTGNADLWVLDTVSGRTFQVTSGPEEDYRPKWSPDGRWLAFMRESWSSHIFIEDIETGKSRQLSTGADRDYDPTVSRDGKWVVWLRGKSGEPHGASRYHLCVAPSAGGEVRELNLGDLTPSARTGIAWSPDAKQIAFAADNGAGNVDIYRVSREGSNLSRVTVRPGVDILPAWSPDGKTIAFTRAAEGETQVWTIPATGGLARQVTFGKGVNQVSVWAPDSDHLAYLSFRGNGRYEIRVVSSKQRTRGASQLVVQAEKINYPVAWSQDGARLVIWKQMQDKSTLWAVSVDGSDRTLIGEEPWDAFAKTHFIKLNAAGRPYRDRLYPGAVHAYQDGENLSDVYVIRVADLLNTDAVARVPEKTK